ncbi:hypothetical protein EON63_00115 [archaeon]|nr:MAG: hypothetical protein EON63_00115 [archaeon]
MCPDTITQYTRPYISTSHTHIHTHTRTHTQIEMMAAYAHPHTQICFFTYTHILTFRYPTTYTFR